MATRQGQLNLERPTIVRTRPGQVLAVAATLALMLAVSAAFLPTWGSVVAVLLAVVVVLLVFSDDSDLPPAAGMALA